MSKDTSSSFRIIDLKELDDGIFLNFPPSTMANERALTLKLNQRKTIDGLLPETKETRNEFDSTEEFVDILNTRETSPLIIHHAVPSTVVDDNDSDFDFIGEEILELLFQTDNSNEFEFDSFDTEKTTNRNQKLRYNEEQPQIIGQNQPQSSFNFPEVQEIEENFEEFLEETTNNPRNFKNDSEEALIEDLIDVLNITTSGNPSKPPEFEPNGLKINNKTAALIMVLLSSMVHPFNFDGHRDLSTKSLPKDEFMIPSHKRLLNSSETFVDEFKIRFTESFDYQPLTPNQEGSPRQLKPFRNKKIDLEKSNNNQSFITASSNYSSFQAPSTFKKKSTSIITKLMQIPKIHDRITPPKPLLQKLSVQSQCRRFPSSICAHSKLGFCLETHDISKSKLKMLIESDSEVTTKHADVKMQSAQELVSVISPVQEKNFNYSYFHPSSYDDTHWIGPEGYICPSKVIYGRPLQAQNARGEWKIIVNDGNLFTQTLRIETCLYPKTPCRMIASCYRSQCLQKYSFHRLLSYDPCQPSKGLYIDIFRLPSSCSCYSPGFYGFTEFA